METSTLQFIKISLVSTTGLSKDALHIYVGMGVMVMTAGLFRKPLNSLWPWAVVVLAAVIGEILDYRDQTASIGYWRWKDSVHDIWNTAFWPTMLFLLSRFTSILRIAK